jgi:excisionase family DNA binding protein
VEQILLRVGDAAEAISMSRAKVYSLIALGEIPSVRLGKSLRVPVDALRESIRQRMEAQSQG